MNVLKNIVLFGLLLGVCVNCGPRKTQAELAKEENVYNELKRIANSAAFKFTANAAYNIQGNDVVPVTNELLRQTENANGRYSLSANEDYMIVSKDSVKANLSYFGELRTVAYADARDNNIVFEGNPTNFVVKENDRKKTVSINFKVKGESEQFTVKMTLFSKEYCNVSIYGSNRTAIRYEGEISAISK